MFAGAFVPNVILVLLYMIFILILALFSLDWRHPFPTTVRWMELFGLELLILITHLTLIILVLGSVISGIATVNQAGA